jgi:copper resistance protein B
MTGPQVLRFALAFGLWALAMSAWAAEDAHHGHHGHETPAPPPATATPEESRPGPEIPVLTDADRAAAFPDLDGMDHAHGMDTPDMLYLLLDQFEWVDAEHGGALRWEGIGWWGNDERRLWLRTEGERAGGETEHAELQLLFGRPLVRWWDLVTGLRHDFGAGPSQTWLVAGVQGLAPYWFETEATLFIGEGGQSGLRLEVEYELLLTNRLILQPLIEINAYGKDDPARGLGSGLARTEAGLRLRYEIRREIAPYLGVSWEKRHGNTADFARQAGEDVSDTALVAGIRLWY